MNRDDFTDDVAEKLGNYVYLYIDPRDESIFYVGKGMGTRATAHMDDATESDKVERIDELRLRGLEPRIDILARNLSEDVALVIERSVIDAIGLENLTNSVRGHGTDSGRDPLSEIIFREGAEPAEVGHKVVAFRLMKNFSRTLSDDELYEVVRGVWKIGRRREEVEYVFGVHNGLVRGVYIPHQWHPAGSTPYPTRKDELAIYGPDSSDSGRWEFTGRSAPQNIQEMYLGKSIRHLLGKGQQNPIKYLGPW